jgi:hypothetical protein
LVRPGESGAVDEHIDGTTRDRVVSLSGTGYEAVNVAALSFQA